MMNLSLGICAYNEAENIGRLLQALIIQELKSASILEMIVVASGCTDGTENLVKEFAVKDKRIILISEPERKGKASAVNAFLKLAKGGACVLISADTLPEKNALEELVKPLLEKNIGMSGGHPVPVNPKGTFTGFLAHFMWELHHEIALTEPKLGEMVAFKNIVKEIPGESAVDEASIEAKIREMGLDIKYCPLAVVYNKGPETLSDFIKQRRRIYTGHLWTRKNQHYEVSTMSGKKIFWLVLKRLKHRPKELPYMLAAIKLEILGRLLGWLDFYVFKKNPSKWDIAATTKNLN